MKILLFGKNGQVGWELQRSLALHGNVLALGRYNQEGYCGDFNNIEGVLKTIEEYRPDVIFNAVAYTAVDDAEENKNLALMVNALAVSAIAKKCKEINALLVHYSTDYVFDGSSQEPYSEESHPNPVNMYGNSKLQGELSIIKSNCDYLIFRTSWVFGLHGKNFIKTIIRLAKTKPNLQVVCDQYGTPTSAAFIADISTHLAMSAVSGRLKKRDIFNLVPDGYTSWCDFARWIVNNHTRKVEFLLNENSIKEISSEEYSCKVCRPKNSRLDNKKLKAVLPKKTIRSWQYYAERVLKVL